MQKLHFIFAVGWFLLSAPEPSYCQFRKEQTKCQVGIFKTAADYKSDRVITAKKVGAALNFNWAGTEYVVKVRMDDSDGVAQKFQGTTIFAYRDEGCMLHKYYTDDNFVDVLYKDGFCLYGLTTLGRISKTEYYFSKDLFSPVQPLTRANLTRAFGNRPAFVSKLHAMKSDAQLSQLDHVNGQYAVVNIFNLTSVE